MNRARWGVVVGILVLLAIGYSLFKTVVASPANVARSGDVVTASRVIAASGGGADDREPLGAVGFLSGSGVVEPADRETKVAGPVAGRIAVIHVKERDVVTAGALLVELEASPERAELDAAEADVAVRNAALARTVRGLRPEDVDALVEESAAAKARAESSATTLARTEQLAATGTLAQEELDRARRQAEADNRTFRAADARRLGGVNGGRQEDIVAARAEVRAAVARRDEARARWERLGVRAPIDGTVLQIKYRVGEFYNPVAPTAASVEPLVILGDMRARRVRVDVDERDVARVAMNAPAYVTLSAYPGRRFSGKVVEISERMGRKNIRTDDALERLDVKIMEVVLQMDDRDELIPGIRVTGYLQASDVGSARASR